MALDLARELLDRCPPWLRAPLSGAFMGALGDGAQKVLLATTAGIRARLPTDGQADDALAAIGAERLIRRGPGEAASTYAVRLRRWWDAHRHRGSTYELLRQLWDFWHVDLAGARIDVVTQLGDRHYLPADSVDGTSSSVVHDSITWDGDGNQDGDPIALAHDANPGDLELRLASLADFPDVPIDVRISDAGGASEVVRAIGTSATPYDRVVLDPATPVVGTYAASASSVVRVGARWAHLWVFFYVDGFLTGLITSDDEELVDEHGDPLVATAIFAGVIDDADAEAFRALPREWSAAHVPYVTVVLLYGLARLWGYPQPITDTWGSPPARTWGSPDPVILIAD